VSTIVWEREDHKAATTPQWDLYTCH